MPPNDGFDHQYADINGLRYHYVRQGPSALRPGSGQASLRTGPSASLRTGSGPPLLLVHGWPGFYYEWHLNIGPLSEHFDVVAPDMRGYAYTDKPDLPPEQGYTPAVFAEDIRALLNHLGWEKASIVSHDFGSVWTQQFARTYPQMVDRLVFFQPVYPGIGPRFLEPGRAFESWYLMFHQLPWAEELVGSSRQATELYLRHFLSHWSYDKALWTDQEIAAFVEAFSQPGALRGGFNCYRAAFRTAGLPVQGDPRIQAPTLVLWAENDSILPVAWSDKLGDFFPNLTLRQVPQAGHWLMREKPELVNEAIIEFCAGR